ncbi:hypothetical protein D3C71_1666070 [compost metagenome]
MIFVFWQAVEQADIQELVGEGFNFAACPPASQRFNPLLPLSVDQASQIGEAATFVRRACGQGLIRQDQQAVIGNPVQSQEADIGSLGPGAEAKAHGRLVQVGRIPDRDRNRLAVQAGQGR